MSVSNNLVRTFNIDDDIFHTSGSSVPINLEVLNSDNLPLSGCVLVETSLIKTFPENILLNDCGCPIDECDEASLKITIKKIPQSKPSCFVDGFVLGDDGLVLFTINGVETQFIASECCENLGFTSELNNNGIYVCRWGEEPKTCDSYTEVDRIQDYVLFTDGDGLNTYEVPTADCCPIDTVAELQQNGNFKCFVPTIIDVCQYFRLDNIESISTIGQVSFFLTPTTTISFTNNPECCTNIGLIPTISVASPDDNTYECFKPCVDYVSYIFDRDGFVVFTANDNTTFMEVGNINCCPIGTTGVIFNNPSRLLCQRVEDNGNTSDACRFLESIYAYPNPSGGLTEITISGKYCTGDDFTFVFSSGFNGVYHNTEIVNTCVIPSTIVISAAPQRVVFYWNDSETCGSASELGYKMLGLRNSGGFNSVVEFNSSICNPANSPLTEQIYLSTSLPLVVNVGDMVLNGNLIEAPFNGQNKWYRVAFSIASTDTEYYIVRINSNGIITEITNC